MASLWLTTNTPFPKAESFFNSSKIISSFLLSRFPVGSSHINILEKINEELGTTILMVTHDQGIVNKMKKRVLVLKDGRLVKDYPKGEYKDESL